MTGDKNMGYTALPVDDAPPAYDEQLASTSAFRRVAQQPMPTPQMSMAGARNPKSLEIGLDGKREWNHSLFGCLDRPGLTFAACFCPCMVYSENQHRRIALTTTGEPLPSSTRPVSLWCGIYALAPQLFGVGQIFLQCFSRSEIRARYGIRGNEIEDAVVSALCPSCSLVQEYREIEAEEQVLRGAGARGPELVFRDEEERIVECAAPPPLVVVEARAPTGSAAKQSAV
ncbi:hypothetical protein JCM3766R1_004165 [Sporobolomyces carnicolor]